ncbi:MAG: hypothetical protein Q6366_004955, partial [Candidatus Freyarchaeota archaeon]
MTFTKANYGRVYAENQKLVRGRFRQCDEHGIYISHQPIYGFRKGYNTASVFCEYFRTHHIMKALSNLRFGSLLDT